MRILCWTITALAVLSIFTWLAFGVSWWHPIDPHDYGDQGRGFVLSMAHWIALLAAPFCEVVKHDH